MRFDNFTRAGVFLAFAANLIAGDPVPRGAVEGHVKIFPLSDVNLADDATAAKTEIEQSYSEYPLIIRSGDRKKEIAEVMADKKGNYRVELALGGLHPRDGGTHSCETATVHRRFEADGARRCKYRHWKFADGGKIAAAGLEPARSRCAAR